MEVKIVLTFFFFFWEDCLQSPEYVFKVDTGWELRQIYGKSTQMSDTKNDKNESSLLSKTQNQLSKQLFVSLKRVL